MIEHMLEEDVQGANDEQNLSKHVCCGVEILINANSATTNRVMCNKFEDAHDNTHRRYSKNHWNIINWRFYERVMHMISIQLFTGGIPQ